MHHVNLVLLFNTFYEAFEALRKEQILLHIFHFSSRIRIDVACKRNTPESDGFPPSGGFSCSLSIPLLLPSRRV
jgi:hypothetical protein